MTTEHHKYREELAAFMVRNGFATGHGDTFEDLLQELEWQITDLYKNYNLTAKNGADPDSRQAQPRASGLI